MLGCTLVFSPNQCLQYLKSGNLGNSLGNGKPCLKIYWNCFTFCVGHVSVFSNFFDMKFYVKPQFLVFYFMLVLKLVSGCCERDLGQGVENISYFYAIHCIQLFMVILGPFGIEIFFGGLKDTKRHHDMKKILLYASTKMKKILFSAFFKT